jgi:biopolymer transport protein ExbB/TolQ
VKPASPNRIALAFLAAFFLLLTPLPPQGCVRAEGGKDKAARASPEETPGEGDKGTLVTLASWAFGIFLGLMSAFMLYIIAEQFAELSWETTAPESLYKEALAFIDQRRFKDSHEHVKDDPCLLARLLCSGMASLQYGLDEGKKAARETLEACSAHKKGRINYLAMIGTLGPAVVVVGPMLGWPLLLGTPLGVAIASVAIVFHRVLTNRLRRFADAAGLVASDLLVTMYHKGEQSRTGES